MGLGPCATYMRTGQWPTPQAQAYWQAVQTGQAPYPYYGGTWAVPPPASAPGGIPGITGEQEVQMLQNQAQMLSQQLEQIHRRIEELEKTEKAEK